MLFKDMKLDESAQVNEYKKNFKDSPAHDYIKIVSVAEEMEKQLSTRQKEMCCVLENKVLSLGRHMSNRLLQGSESQLWHRILQECRRYIS